MTGYSGPTPREPCPECGRAVPLARVVEGKGRAARYVLRQHTPPGTRRQPSEAQPDGADQCPGSRRPVARRP